MNSTKYCTPRRGPQALNGFVSNDSLCRLECSQNQHGLATFLMIQRKDLVEIQHAQSLQQATDSFFTKRYLEIVYFSASFRGLVSAVSTADFFNQSSIVPRFSNSAAIYLYHFHMFAFFQNGCIQVSQIKKNKINCNFL